MLPFTYRCLVTTSPIQPAILRNIGTPLHNFYLVISPDELPHYSSRLIMYGHFSCSEGGSLIPSWEKNLGAMDSARAMPTKTGGVLYNTAVIVGAKGVI